MNSAPTTIPDGWHHAHEFALSPDQAAYCYVLDGLPVQWATADGGSLYDCDAGRELEPEDYQALRLLEQA